MAKNKLLGIDIGTDNIKVFVGAVQADGGISIEGNGIMSSNCFDKGVILDQYLLAATVRQAVECAISNDVPQYTCLGIGGMGLTTFDCVGSIALGNPEAIAAEDIERACRAAEVSSIPENYTVLHVFPRCFWVDGCKYTDLPVNVRGQRLEVEAHIVAVPQNVIYSLLNALRNEGIFVNKVVANAVPQSEYLISSDCNNYIFMDLGAGTTDVAVYRAKKPYHIVSLPIGGKYVTKDIMQALSVSQSHAEEIKRYYTRLDNRLRGQQVILDCNDYGTNDKHVCYDFLYDVIESRIEEIIDLIYDSVQPAICGCVYDSLYITGGCALMPSIRNRLAAKFGLNVVAMEVKELLPEYAYAGNTACYGLLRFAGKSITTVPKAEKTKESLFNMFKKFLMINR